MFFIIPYRSKSLLTVLIVSFGSAIASGYAFVWIFKEDGKAVVSQNEVGLADDGLAYRRPSAFFPFSGTVIDHHENGQLSLEQIYANGVVTKETHWYESGKIKAEGSGRKYEEPDGKWTRWYENGNKEFEEHFKNGKRDGKWNRWYASGQMDTDWSHRDDKPSGKWTSWHENGQKSSEQLFIGGVREGLYTTWYSNGQKRSEERFLYGKLDGDSTVWDENGQVTKEAIYEDGELIEEKIYSPE